MRIFKIIVASVLAIVIFYLLLTYLEAFSVFGAAMLLVFICIGLFYSVDRWVLNEIDTIEEIKKGNIAYGLFMLSYAVICGSAIVSAFSVFK